jgi:CMP-N-acetylneuraminic acid synthetase
MKIIAVIPARGGSKGIPNKNVRLLHGRPMVYYAISNALCSQYITKTIVTSDSMEVLSIAKCLGVYGKRRNSDLCTEETTLDTVVYDAVKDEQCDIVVTLQPTSPILQAETLDRAIQYFLNHDLDTLISVVNRPRLSWVKREGMPVPVYKQRLNRQYLPPEYEEAGAFVISRQKIVTCHSRIGKNVDIFEIPEEEAIDIDNYQELLYAQHILQRKKVAIYVNGNSKRGMGHIYRSLDMADEFCCRVDIFYHYKLTEKSMFGDTTHHLIGINHESEIMDYVKKEQYAIFINDVLETSIEYMDELKKASADMKIINFEDYGEGVYKADLVINALYQNATYPNMKTGEKYYIAPRMFLFYPPIKIREKVQTVFISFGGADPQNYTQRLVNIITKKEYRDIQFLIAIGRAYADAEIIMKYNQYKNIDTYYDVKNMPELMSKCDIAVTSRGRTGYELALLGIPTISIAQNEREEKHGFVSAEHGFLYLGLNPGDMFIESSLNIYLKMNAADRQKLQKKLLSHDLKSGRKRVLSLIDSL